jgi:hypothetical protein
MARNKGEAAKADGRAFLTAKLCNTLSLLSLLLLVFAILLLFEVLRPFHDLEIDGPIALWSIIGGVVLALVAVWLRRGSRLLHVTALVLNAVALAALLVVIYGLSHMKMF